MTPVVGTPVSGDVLLTAEEYEKLPDSGLPTELVRGRVIEMSRPTLRHGEICSKVPARRVWVNFTPTSASDLDVVGRGDAHVRRSSM